MTNDSRPRRSVLYMPGSNVRALEKARELDTDCVIFDLEDAVAPDAKDDARLQVAASVKACGFGTREVIVRVNGLDTPWGKDDIAAVAPAGAAAILVPKVSRADDVRRFTAAIAEAGVADNTRLWAMMETPAAIFNAEPIAATAGNPGVRLDAFVLGTNDLAKETRARLVPGRAPMLPWIMTIVAAARLHGLAVIDGVYNDISDLDGFETECRQGVDCGLDGKTLIHPKQLEAANRVFAPSDDEVAFARKVIEAFELPDNAGRGALKIDGKMVERLHAEMARQTVAIADAIAARSV